MSVERIGSGTTRDHRRDAWWGVHAARYNFAVPFVKERRVLDIACGTGYGLPVLHRVASAVVGVDVEFLAARKARGDGQERALVADGCRLPFEDGSFDVATSFETLEHIQQRSTFVSELRRVLARDGLLILSTPNANHTRPVDGKPHNPYHVFAPPNGAGRRQKLLGGQVKHMLPPSPQSVTELYVPARRTHRASRNSFPSPA